MILRCSISAPGRAAQRAHAALAPYRRARASGVADAARFTAARAELLRLARDFTVRNGGVCSEPDEVRAAGGL